VLVFFQALAPVTPRAGEETPEAAAAAGPSPVAEAPASPERVLEEQDSGFIFNPLQDLDDSE